MRLEMGNIYIKDIQFADTSKIEDGILYVDKGAVKAVALEDEHIKTVTFDIAKPGESHHSRRYRACSRAHMQSFWHCRRWNCSSTVAHA